MTLIADETGTMRHIEHIRLADEMIALKKTSGSNPWPVIEKCIDVFKKIRPQQYKSFLFDLGETKATRKEKKFASTYDKVHGGYLRYTLDIPEYVVYLIRKIYNVDELPMNRQFFIEFAKRFPAMKVAEKL